MHHCFKYPQVAITKLLFITELLNGYNIRIINYYTDSEDCVEDDQVKKTSKSKMLLLVVMELEHSS